MRIPDHAAVSETVRASRTLGKPWARGLLNATLRRYGRERDALLEDLTEAAAAAHPRWLYDEFAGAWPDALAQLLDAGNSEPPMTLRVNRRHGNRDDYLQRLAAAGLEARAGELCPDAVYLARPVPVQELPGFSEGHLSVQDEAAQLAARFLAPSPGDAVLDACAAPGGKACHLLEIEPRIELTALDLDGRRLQRVRDNLRRLGLHANCREGDAASAAALFPTHSFQRILIDAPCTATGVIRRHPDIKVLRRPDDGARLAERQRRILAGCWSRLTPGGVLLYATCSVLDRENSDVVADFLAAQHDAEEAALTFEGARPCRHGLQLLPRADGPDGLYYALLRKRA